MEGHMSSLLYLETANTRTSRDLINKYGNTYEFTVTFPAAVAHLTLLESRGLSLRCTTGPGWVFLDLK